MARLSSVNRNETFGENSNKDAALGTGTLVFPQDMEKEFYPEAIKFSVYERHGVDYVEFKDIAKTAFQSGGNFIKYYSEINLSKVKIDKLTAEIKSLETPVKKNQEKADAARANKAADLVKEQERSFSSSLALEEELINLKEQKDKLDVVFKDIEGKNSLKQTKTRHLKSIYLAMPESLNFAEGVDWQGTDLGVMGALKSGAIKNLEGGLDYGILSGGGAALGGAAGLGASLIPGISGIAGTVVGAVLGGSGLQSGIESTFSVKTNPFKEQTFQGVGFRPFDFAFTFRPRSSDDVKVVQNIIQTFRAYSKPTFKSDSNGAIFKYPKEFLIEFLTIGVDNSYETNKYIPQIKFCVCTAVNTNFTGTGWRSFKDGAPTEITLQLTFQETEIITGEDVLGNTEVGRYKDTGRNF